jgi:hypothetical protein
LKRGYLLIAVIIAAALLVSVPLFNTTKEDFSTYNTDWNGASRIQDLAASEGYTTRDIFALNEVGSSGNGVLVMLNPNKTVAVTSEDTSSMKTFVQNGGSLVLANDFGNANAILSGLGVAGSVRFNGALLSDSVSRGVDSAHPLVTNISSSGLTAGVHTLYFNYGTALIIPASASNVTALAQSAPTSYLRASSGNNAPIAGSGGAHPVLASVAYGKGRIILLSDPSVFINGMLDQADNQQLFTSMIANLTGGNTAVPILFDQSHRVSQPVWSLAYDRINADDNVKYTVILLAIAAFVVGINVTAVTRRRRAPVEPTEVHVNEEAVIQDLVKTHPGWRRERIEGFLRQVRGRRRTTHGNRK